MTTRLGLEVVGRWGGKREGEGLKVAAGTCFADTVVPAQPVLLHRGWGPTGTVCHCHLSRVQATGHCTPRVRPAPAVQCGWPLLLAAKAPMPPRVRMCGHRCNQSIDNRTPGSSRPAWPVAPPRCRAPKPPPQGQCRTGSARQTLPAWHSTHQRAGQSPAAPPPAAAGAAGMVG